MSRAKLDGMQFDRLKVIGFSSIRYNKCYWECLCVCGNITEVSSSKLIHGITKSCGCLAKEIARALRISETKHGHTKNKKATKTYSTWRSMWGRCLNPKHVDYARYGAKGITLCERWLKFENFLLDMSERPSGTTIDRIDNSLGYQLNNCRWASPTQQSRNQTKTKLTIEKAIKIRSDTRKQVVIASEYGVSRATIYLIKKGRIWIQ